MHVPYTGVSAAEYRKKLKEENSSSLNEYIGKAGLYFQDTLWYYRLLHEAVGKLTADLKPGEEQGAWAPPAIEPQTTFEEVVDQTLHAEEESQVEHTEPELLIEIPKPKFEPIEASKTELTFEPYHTVDYFASQGIKPPEEEKSQDRFTSQLKSLTEWLK